jgi:hypothetical protein
MRAKSKKYAKKAASNVIALLFPETIILKQQSSTFGFG